MDDETRVRFAQTFDRAAELYERVRPGFAEASLDWVLPLSGRVLDLGAGTGKLTVSLVARGLDVVAIDPSPNMLAQLRAKLDVETQLGTAEQIELPDASVDAIVVGSAFHWFDRPAADREMARVLRPGGSVGLLWNQRDRAASPAVAAFDAAQHHADEGDPSRSAQRAVLDPSLFTAMQRRDFPHVQRLRRDELVDLVASRSYVIAMDEPARSELLERVRAAVDTFPELARSEEFDLPYLTLTLRSTRR